MQWASPELAIKCEGINPVLFEGPKRISQRAVMGLILAVYITVNLTLAPLRERAGCFLNNTMADSSTLVKKRIQVVPLLFRQMNIEFDAHQSLILTVTFRLS